MELRDYLEIINAGRELDQSNAEELMRCLLSSDNQIQIAGLLCSLNHRLPTAVEIDSYQKVLYSEALQIHLPNYIPLDVCGTGGDGKDTFNISTLTGFVLAACGIKIAKHGNYGASSKCGSSNIIEQIGLKFINQQSQIEEALEQVGFVYLHAPLFHPVLKNLAEIRKKLGVRTVFNLLGPLLNPISNTVSFCGLAKYEFMSLYSDYFQSSDKLFMLAHSLGNYDEISLTSDAKLIFNNKDRKICQRIVRPSDFGQDYLSPESISAVNDLKLAAQQFLDILAGKGTSQQTAVVSVNAACAYHLLNQNLSLHDSYKIVEDKLLSGGAFKVYKDYQKFLG